MTGSEKKQERALFQSVSSYYSTSQSVEYYSASARDDGLYPPELALVENFMTSPATILDVGCGAGREAVALAQMGFMVTGVDIAEPLINEARRIAVNKELNIEFLLGDGRNLDFTDDSFDYVLLISQMIHHVPRRENRLNLLQEAGRVLGPRGSIILTYHDWDIEKNHRPWGYKKGKHKSEPSASELSELNESLEPGDYFRRDCQGIRTEVLGFYHHFTKNEIENEILDAGLKISDRASFENVAGGDPDTFWKPTQILVLKRG